MAVIDCPSCKKKISDKAKTCSHCNIDLQSLDQEGMQLIKQTQRIAHQQKLMNHSFIALLLFCGGFLFIYWQDNPPGSWQYITAITSTILGFVIYLITRVRILLAKRKS